MSRSTTWALAALGGALIAAGACSQSGSPAPPPERDPDVADPGPGERDVIVHLFEWPWSSIAAECTDVLGPRGFGAVQVSPPQEHVVLPGRGFPWWQDYQPVSYQLMSRRGDRAAFAAMVDACHDAGVKVYVDAVLNHMAGGASAGAGSAGSSFSHYDYPAVPYVATDFHHCGRNASDDIQVWTSRAEVQTCELVDLADLATESDAVRDQLAGYLDDLISLGVDGFRIDAAKHMALDDLAAVFDRLADPPIVFSEVIEGGIGEISPVEYVATGDVTEFRYGDVVSSAFRGGQLADLEHLADDMALASADAVAFIDNHDTQRNGRAVLTYKDGAAYALAEAFLLAFPYGTPQVMSSFAFDGPDQGPPAGESGATTAVDCDDGWVCEHRVRTTANLVGFHDQVAGTELVDWWSNGSDQIAFGRGEAGFAVFNRGEDELVQVFATSMPAGVYCDVTGGELDGGACTGATVTVEDDGALEATVGPDSVLAIHTGARVESP